MNLTDRSGTPGVVNPPQAVPVSREATQVLVVGGGQAGLALSYHLANRGTRHLVLETAPEIGHAWRSRWDSLKLFTAAQYNGLPGMPFPAEPDSYPSKDAVADFLQVYAAQFELPVRLNTTVTRLRKTGSSRYVAETTTGRFEAEQVVIATGPFQMPFTPDVTSELGAEVTQLHSAAYQTPAELPGGRVLVVGAANSGQQIALELAEAGRDVDIAVGQKLPTLPQRWLGRDLWWWLTTLRIAKIPVSSRVGQRLSQRDVVIGGGLRELRRRGVGVKQRVAGADGRSVRFDDGESAAYDVVVWATGFRNDHSWIDIPEVKDDRGSVRHVRGVTDSPGLFLLGMTWQHTRTSALLGWVGEDAAYLADQIATTNGSHVSAEAAATRT